MGLSSTLLRTCARHTSWGTFKQNDHSLLGSGTRFRGVFVVYTGLKVDSFKGWSFQIFRDLWKLLVRKNLKRCGKRDSVLFESSPSRSFPFPRNFQGMFFFKKNEKKKERERDTARWEASMARRETWFMNGDTVSEGGTPNERGRTFPWCCLPAYEARSGDTNTWKHGTRSRIRPYRLGHCSSKAFVNRSSFE